MKKVLLKFQLITLMMLAMGILTGCPDPDDINPDKKGSVKITFKETGPGYVDLNVEASAEFEAAYSIGTSKRSISSPSILFASGKKVTLVPDQTLRISADIQETTTYYLYIAARLSAEEYSEIFEIEFTTPDYEFSNLLTVVGIDYDGYKMQVTVPKSVKTGNSAIRYNQSDLMMYNYQTKFGANDDYFSLLYNASKYLKEDTILEYSEELNWEEGAADVNEDGVIDENDITISWNPISPGEPVVFVAGEFEWMEEPEDWPSDKNYSVNGFSFPAGWDPGYYLPCLDPEKYWGYYGIETRSMNLIEADVKTDIDGFWTGAFQRKIFKVKEPEKMDAKVQIEAIDITPVDATLIMTPEEGVEQYAFGVFDDASLNQLLELCDGKEEYFQWAITSYFSMYNFGTRVAAGNVELHLDGDIFYEGMVPSDSDIHVLVTAMGNSNASVQSFNRYSFHTKEKVMDAPEIVVTPLVEESSPFLAAFNIKCTTWNDASRGPVKKCYYGANYKKDFILAVNGNKTYFELAQSQPFSAEEIEKINSDEGYTIKIPTIDGETTRLAVAGYNIENTPNNFNFKDISECPAVADVTTPYRDYKPYVKSDLFDVLTGEWTATATLDDGSVHSSPIRISRGIFEGDHYPADLPDSVYTIYEEMTKYTKEQVDGSFQRFKDAASEYNKNRLEYQNNLLIEGWVDKDTYNRLDYYNPWDLFTSRVYSGVDEKSMFSDFGPKIYLEVSEGDKLSVTADMYYMPPVSYSSIPYYLVAYNPKRSATEGNLMYYETYTADEYVPLTFPVELSEDRNTITIKAIEDSNGGKWYPTLLGFDQSSLSGFAVSASYTVSDIVITRGTDGTRAAATKAAAPSRNKPAGEALPFGHKSLTRFKNTEKREVMNFTVSTGKMVEERLEKLAESLKNRQNQNN